MNKTDYMRSFLQFTTDHTDHTPRAQIDATCRLVAPDGSACEYVLNAGCISENMYVPKNLTQEPASEFLMIASRSDYMIMKDFSSARPGLCEARRVGERMSTHDGKGSAILRIDISMVEFSQARKLVEYDEIREAILGNRPLNGRTTYLHEDGKTQVVMDYPIRICNVPRAQRRWQVDTGRVLAAVRPMTAGLAVTQFAPAYVVYNDWGWAELAAFTLSPTPGQESCAPHYGAIRRIEAKNEIFCIGAA